MKATGPTVAAWFLTVSLVAGGVVATGQTTNRPAATNASSAPRPIVAPTVVVPPPVTNPSAPTAAAPQRVDESAFRIISERNIFNANRSGGKVQLATRRATRIETFTLVGTMAYEKGAFAFFEGSSSEFSKVLKADGIIAGHKLVDVLTDGVKLEADGKQFELMIGSGMRREDAGAWLVAESGGGNNSSSTYIPSRSGDSGSRSSRASRGSDSDRSRRSEVSTPGSNPIAPPATPAPSVDRSEILKRLMERREKE